MPNTNQKTPFNIRAITVRSQVLLNKFTVRWNSFFSLVEVGFIVALVLASLADGGDLEMTAIYLVVSWFLSAFRLLTAKELTGRQRGLGLVVTSAGLIVLGIFAQMHGAAQQKDFAKLISGYIPKASTSIQTASAYVQIEPISPERVRDGAYYFPVMITNTGNGAVEGYEFYFTQETWDSPSTSQGEHELMSIAENGARNLHLTYQKVANAGLTLAAGQIKVIRQPENKFNEFGYQQIMNGKLFLHYAVVLVYVDARSERDHALYYSERCARYDANYASMIDCGIGHNFADRKWPW